MVGARLDRETIDEKDLRNFTEYRVCPKGGREPFETFTRFGSWNLLSSVMSLPWTGKQMTSTQASR